MHTISMPAKPPAGVLPLVEHVSVRICQCLSMACEDWADICLLVLALQSKCAGNLAEAL